MKRRPFPHPSRGVIEESTEYPHPSIVNLGPFSTGLLVVRSSAGVVCIGPELSVAAPEAVVAIFVTRIMLGTSWAEISSARTLRDDGSYLPWQDLRTTRYFIGVQGSWHNTNERGTPNTPQQ